jgi:hypothetical protein
MSTFRLKSIVFNPGPDERALKLTAKCYSPGTSNPNGSTLLCAHGAGTREFLMCLSSDELRVLIPYVPNRQGAMGAGARTDLQDA